MDEYIDGAPQMDRVLGALADPTRRAILSRLAAGDARVTDLARPFAISLNSVSKHIRTLERARLVRRRIEGRDHVLTLTPGPLGEAERWIAKQTALWTWRVGELEKALDDG